MHDPIELAGDTGGGGFGAGHLTFIGNATVLLRYGGSTILTDPNFLHAGDHARLGWGLRSERLRDPALEIGDLPALVLVVLSHHHGDHFDPVAAEHLDEDLPIVTEPASARKLERQGFRTLLHERLHEIPERYPDIDLCLLHLGGTRIAGILLTMDAVQGVRALRIVRPRTAVPVHYDDYTVFRSSLEDFRSAVAGAHLSTEIREVERGETWTFRR